MLGQTEAQTEQFQTQTVQSENKTGSTETHMVVENTLKEHEGDISQNVDFNGGNGNGIDAINGNGAADGKVEEDLIRPQDSISNVQSRHHDSSVRSSSSRSSAPSVRRKTEAEQAALLARAAALKDKHALEEQELILRRKREQLELETELAATSAKLAVLHGGSSIHSRQSE